MEIKNGKVHIKRRDIAGTLPDVWVATEHDTFEDYLPTPAVLPIWTETGLVVLSTFDLDPAPAPETDPDPEPTNEETTTTESLTETESLTPTESITTTESETFTP
jgi:hypothetical protein